MKSGINRLLKYAALGLSLAAMAQAPSALADASAIAYGSGGEWGWATRSTQQEANRIALTNCNKGTAKRDCTLDTTKAIARAEGGGRISIRRSSVSLADAKKLALDGCGSAECKITFSLTKPGFYSVFKAELDEEGNGGFFIAHQYSNSDEADKDAREGCQKHNKGECKILWSGAIAGVYNSTPASAPAPHPVAERNCRPTTPSVRCSSQCTNGNCIVTYENGCKIRVQVPARFDSFNNQWTYPAPSC